jgi:4-hydroxy-2-oxoheptanedioate aldolase
MGPEIRRRLAEGRNLAGMMHFTGSPMLVEVMASAGLDFVNIDMEHSPIDVGLAAHCIRAADAAGIAANVRVPTAEPGIIKVMLNLGTPAIIVPHATLDTCRAAVRALRYEPAGERGSCPAIRAAGYSQPDWAAYTRRANAELSVIPLLEDAATIEAVDEVLAIDGVDIVFLGPFDYSVALGIPGATFDHPRMAEGLERVVRLARARSKYVMTSVGARIDPGYAREIYAMGVRLISYSADALVFLEACRAIAATRG